MKLDDPFNAPERAILFAARKLRLRYRVIDLEGDPYLLRIYLLRVFRQWLPGVYLHCFLRGDADRELHNHPWQWAVSLLLAGGYQEERATYPFSFDDHGAVRRKYVRLRAPAVNRIGEHDYHRVDLTSRHCWTLFIAGKRISRWGFLDPSDGSFAVSDEVPNVQVFR